MKHNKFFKNVKIKFLVKICVTVACCILYKKNK